MTTEPGWETIDRVMVILGVVVLAVLIAASAAIVCRIVG